MSRRRRRSGGSTSTGAAARHHDLLALVFDTDAHRAMEAHCSRDPQREVCGVLVGFTGVAGRQSWTRVVAVIEGIHAREEQMSVTFTHETWDAVHDVLAARQDGAKVVGWYHSHPDFGVFYSSPDAFVHRNFFGSDGQVGIVVDPVRRESGAFVSKAGSLVTLDRYEVARVNARGHLVTCRYIDDPLRDTRPEATAAAESDQSRSHAIETALAVLDSRTRHMALVQWIWIPIAIAMALASGILIGSSLSSRKGNLPAGAASQQSNRPESELGGAPAGDARSRPPVMRPAQPVHQEPKAGAENARPNTN